MNSTSNHNQSLKDLVMEKIRTDGLSMRPRLYFSVVVIATTLVTFIVLAISIFLFNFLLFGLEASGRSVLLGFGQRGFLTFLQVFPWGLLTLDILLVGLLGWLVHQFKFGYKIPLLFVFVGLLALIALFGSGMKMSTNINSILSDQDELGILPPPFKGVYNDVHRLPSPNTGFYRSIVTNIEGGTITVENTESGTTTMMIILPRNENRATTSGLHVGDTIFVVGDKDRDEVLHAFGLHKTFPRRMLKSRMGASEK